MTRPTKAPLVGDSFSHTPVDPLAAPAVLNIADSRADGASGRGYQCQMASCSSKSWANCEREMVCTPSHKSSTEMPRSARSSATT